MTEHVTGVTAAPIQDPGELVNYAQAYHGSEVIRCVESHGTVTDFVACPEVDAEMWIGIRYDPHRDVIGDGWITETNAVRETIKLCDPDVSLVSESESVFAEARDE